MSFFSKFFFSNFSKRLLRIFSQLPCGHISINRLVWTPASVLINQKPKKNFKIAFWGWTNSELALEVYMILFFDTVLILKPINGHMPRSHTMIHRSCENFPFLATKYRFDGDLTSKMIKWDQTKHRFEILSMRSNKGSIVMIHRSLGNFPFLTAKTGLTSFWPVKWRN